MSRLDAAADGPGLVIRLLGGFEIRVGDVAVPAEAFPRRKTLALVKLLALRAGRAVSREVVIEALWPTLEPEGAVAQLQNAASQARLVLRSAHPGGARQPWIVLAGGTVSLAAPGGVSTDLEAFDALVDRALTSRARCDLQEAASAFTGLLLPGDPYEPWVEDERARTLGAAARVWSELGRRSLADGLPDDAAEAFEHVVQLQPDDLEAHRSLLRLAASAGNRFALERRVRSLEDTFEAQLGVPLPTSLVEEIRALRDSVDRPRTESSGPVPLPVPSTPLVGRWDDLARLLERLHAPGCRLVTVTGVGGVGKTRLALEAARWWAAAGGQAAFVGLEGAEDVPTVLARAAAALGLPPSPGSLEERLVSVARVLSDRRTLLVLDNVERVPDAAWEVESLVGRARDCRCLVTSRHRLGVTGEWLFELRGLPVGRAAAPRLPVAATGAGGPGPGPLPAGSGGSAVDLFVACAKRVVPALRFDAEALDAAREICRSVEGLPLAIELAAGWLRVLSPQALVAEVRDGGLLVGEGSGEGTTAIVDVFERSWRWLSAARQRTYLALSVFRGGFSRELAYEVAGAATADLLAFVDASLVQREDDERFRLHEVLRRLAERRLEATDDAEGARRRHAETMLATAETLDHEIRGPLQGRWMALAERERGNFEAALAWSEARPDGSLFVRLAAALATWWERAGELNAGLAWLGRALERTSTDGTGSVAERARVLLGLGVLERHRGLWVDAGDHLGEAERLAGDAGDARTAAYARHQQAVLQRYRGRPSAAKALHGACLDAFRAMGDTVGQYLSLFHLADLEQREGDVRVAEELQTEALERARERGDAWTIASSLYRLGCQAFDRGDADAARDRLRESLALRRSLGDRIGVLASLGALARATPDDPEHAAELLAAADAGREALALRLPPEEEEGWRRTEALLRGALGGEAYRAAVGRGRDRPLDAVLDDAAGGGERS